MSDDTSDPNLVQSTRRNAAVLALFALVAVSLTAITWVLTKDKIQTEKELALLRAIHQLVPEDSFANDPYSDCILITAPQFLGTEGAQKAWRLRDATGTPTGLVISSVAPNGYTGPIEFIVGYQIQETQDLLSGVRVTAHQETPGLGDKIDVNKSDWIFSLNDHPVTEVKTPKWQVTKDGGDFDAFTGATITPRALLKAITLTTDYYRNHRGELLNRPSNCVAKKE